MLGAVPYVPVLNFENDKTCTERLPTAPTKVPKTEETCDRGNYLDHETFIVLPRINIPGGVALLALSDQLINPTVSVVYSTIMNIRHVCM